jgi:hypothetical protein
VILKPTQTSGTRHAYARRARQILNRVNLELLAKESRKAQPHEVVSHLGRHRHDLASASWRQYKAALIGHAVDVTAFTHYGQRSPKTAGGLGPPLVNADPAEVARIRRKLEAGLKKLAQAKIVPQPISMPDNDIDECNIIGPTA